MQPENETVEYTESLKLVKEGYSIFPIHIARRIEGEVACTCGKVYPESHPKSCRGKHPVVKFTVKTINDKKSKYEKRENPSDYWLNRDPPYGIGIHCGKSHIWVLDIDGKEGMDELKVFTDKYGELPKTRTIQSGSGGIHYYWAAWEKNLIISSSNKQISGNIDIKGNDKNSYVVAPPTMHLSGKRYEYINRCPPIDAPEWLIKIAKSVGYVNTNGKPNTEDIKKRVEYETPIYKLLNKEQMSHLHREGNYLKGKHPIHGSATNRNFTIDLSTNRWFCYRHNSNGGLIELAAMLDGLCKCEEFNRKNLIKPLSGKNFALGIDCCLKRNISDDELLMHISKGRITRR